MDDNRVEELKDSITKLKRELSEKEDELKYYEDMYNKSNLTLKDIKNFIIDNLKFEITSYPDMYGTIQYCNLTFCGKNLGCMSHRISNK